MRWTVNIRCMSGFGHDGGRPGAWSGERGISQRGSMKNHIFIITIHCLNTVELQRSLRESQKWVRGCVPAPQQFLATSPLPCQSSHLLMCTWTDCKCFPQRLALEGPRRHSSPTSPHCLTYVAIDQAPVSASHICTQTSVALISLTVTDDHAPRRWCKWWMNGSALHFTVSLSLSLSVSVFRQVVWGVIITPQHLDSLPSGWEHSVLIK